MLRFLIACVVVVGVYVSTTYLSKFDNQVTIALYGYHIKTTAFTIVTVFVISTFIALVTLRFISLIFDVPSIIKNMIQARSAKKSMDAFIHALLYIIINEREKARKLINKLSKNIHEDYPNIVTLLEAETAEVFHSKTEKLKTLLESDNEYNYFATKSLAKHFYNNRMYTEAQTYANIAFNLNEFDSEVLNILIHTLGENKSFTKLDLVARRLAKINPDALNSISLDIAKYYSLAANEQIELSKNQEALAFLESALKIAPNYEEALELYSKVSLSLNKTDKALEFCAISFKNSPSFEVAKLYVKLLQARNKSDLEIYNALCNLAEPRKNLGVFLAIAAYLDMHERISELLAINYE